MLFISLENPESKMLLQIIEKMGNEDLFKCHKTAFLCSRDIPASAVLKSYDWAIEQRDRGNCIISGYHSKIEKDVLHYLLKGRQPVIMVLARGMKEKIEPELKEAIEAGRLLIVTPFEKEVKRVTKGTAEKRNRFMVEIADEIVVGYVNEKGMINKILMQTDKIISRLS